MELKPIKESEKKSYPTISGLKKSNFMNNIIFTVSPSNFEKMEPIPVAVPGYAPSNMPLEIFRIVRNVTFITIVIFLILLIKNKIKMIKDSNKNEEKMKKYIKLDWIFLIISIFITIATIIGIVILKR